MSTASIAIGAIVIVVVSEHAAIWSLFFRRGWKVSVPPVPKPAEAPDATVVLNVQRGPDGKFQRAS